MKLVVMAHVFGRKSGRDFGGDSAEKHWCGRGQTAGGVREILTPAEIIRQLVEQTEAALARAPGLQ